jgi:hypothetical protein
MNHIIHLDGEVLHPIKLRPKILGLSKIQVIKPYEHRKT